MAQGSPISLHTQAGRCRRFRDTVLHLTSSALSPPKKQNHKQSRLSHQELEQQVIPLCPSSLHTVCTQSGVGAKNIDSSYESAYGEQQTASVSSAPYSTVPDSRFQIPTPTYSSVDPSLGARRVKIGICNSGSGEVGSTHHLPPLSSRATKRYVHTL